MAQSWKSVIAVLLAGSLALAQHNAGADNAPLSGEQEPVLLEIVHSASGDVPASHITRVDRILDENQYTVLFSRQEAEDAFDDVWVFNRLHATYQKIAHDVVCAYISPVGATVVINEGNGKLYTVNVWDGVKISEVAEHGGFPASSPSGKQIAYVELLDSDSHQYLGDVVVYNVAKDERVTLFKHNEQEEIKILGWSPNGTKIYIAVRDGNQTTLSFLPYVENQQHAEVVTPVKVFPKVTDIEGVNPWFLEHLLFDVTNNKVLLSGEDTLLVFQVSAQGAFTHPERLKHNQDFSLPLFAWTEKGKSTTLTTVRGRTLPFKVSERNTLLSAGELSGGVLGRK